jgi:hypothetical protein
MADIYRVTVKTTGSVQPKGTFWNREVIYCGTDRDAARVAYHGSTPRDNFHGFGNPARETDCEVITDAGLDDFAADDRKQAEV